MNRKTFFFILIAALFVVLVALCWWWFLGRVPQTLTPPAGGFGSAANKAGAGSASGPRTNIAIPSVAGLGGIPAGTYTLKTLDGKIVGSYTITPQNGGYAVNPSIAAGRYVLQTQNGQTMGIYTVAPTTTSGVYTFTPSALLPAGTYTLSTSNGSGSPATYRISTDGQIPSNLAPGTYLVEGPGGVNIGSCFVDTGGGACVSDLTSFIDTGPTSVASSTPYLGDINTPGVDWFFAGTPTIDLGSTVDTGGQSVVGSPGTAFNPTDTNQIAGSNPSGGLLPNFDTVNGQPGGLGLGGALAGAAAAGAVKCLGPYAVGVVQSALGVGGGTVATGAGAALAVLTNDVVANAAINPGSIAFTNSVNAGEHTTDQARTVMNCVFVTIGKAMVQQLTTSLVNWINSGFQGTPSFVTNPTQFFTNVADVAAGQFIQGSALSFLCSPFKLQIKIAIAYSYANQNANSCTLTGILNNGTNFANNIFNSNGTGGGWSNFLSFTMSPTNNPYGAYAYAQNGLNTAVAKAQGQFQVQLNQGRGFLSLQQKQNCHVQATAPANVNINQFSKTIVSNNSFSSGNGDVVINGGTGTANTQSVTPFSTTGSNLQGPTQSGAPIDTNYQVCDLVNTTPGSVIAGALDNTLKLPSDALNLAQSFDQVIGALAQQLMGAFQANGLLGLSQNGGPSTSIGYTVDQQAAQATGQSLIDKMKSETTSYQQLGTIKQGEIGDIQAVQSRLNDLKNCWDVAVKKWQALVDSLSNAAANPSGFAQPGLNQGTTTTTTSLEAAQSNLALAEAGAKSVADNIASYQAQVDSLNQNITDINSAIAQLEQYQSRALSLGSSGDASTLTAEYLGANVHITATDLTNESQNRATLQATLTSPSGSVNTSLAQCHAL